MVESRVLSQNGHTVHGSWLRKAAFGCQTGLLSPVCAPPHKNGTDRPLCRRLVPYTAPPLPSRNGSSSCRAFEPAFSLGRCLLTINFDQMRATPAPGAALAAITNAWNDVVGATSAVQVSGSSSSGNVVAFPFVRGALPAEALGVAPLPGSEIMYDREKCVLAPCSPANCPNAVNTSCAASVGVQNRGRVGPRPDTGYRGPGCAAANSRRLESMRKDCLFTNALHRCPQATDPRQRRSCIVNRAPLVAGLGYDYSASPDADAAALGRLAVLQASADAALKRWPEAVAGTLLIGSATGRCWHEMQGECVVVLVRLC